MPVASDTVSVNAPRARHFDRALAPRISSGPAATPAENNEAGHVTAPTTAELPITHLDPQGASTHDGRDQV